jgi:LmbE family N-acetylglucosaminyl deacetylase
MAGTAPDPIRRVVISPHLDDAVFGCGEWLAAHPGATVVTVMTAMPDDRDQCTDWDTQCGFRSADEAMQARWIEDRAALAHVQAGLVWLDFLDSQYTPSTPPQAVADALVRTLRELGAQDVLMPLGMFHPDHRLVHEAMLLAAPRLPGVRIRAYEDAVYRTMPGQLQERLAALMEAGIKATPAPSEAMPEHAAQAKQAAVDCYASQLLAIPEELQADLRRPERIWVLEGGVFPSA